MWETKNTIVIGECKCIKYSFSSRDIYYSNKTIKKAIGDFLKFRDEDGALKELGNSFKKTFSHAINDSEKKYPGKTDAEKKAIVLTELCKKYDKVVFVDDDKKNVSAAKELNIKNLKVIKAWDE